MEKDKHHLHRVSGSYLCVYSYLLPIMFNACSGKHIQYRNLDTTRIVTIWGLHIIVFIKKSKLMKAEFYPRLKILVHIKGM